MSQRHVCAAGEWFGLHANLRGRRYDRLIGELRGSFDLIVLDCAPVLAVAGLASPRRRLTPSSWFLVGKKRRCARCVLRSSNCTTLAQTYAAWRSMPSIAACLVITLIRPTISARAEVECLRRFHVLHSHGGDVSLWRLLRARGEQSRVSILRYQRALAMSSHDVFK